ncbi:MAG: hypothetical protein AAF235_07775 [Planctomycetota bacterium]
MRSPVPTNTMPRPGGPLLAALAALLLCVAGGGCTGYRDQLISVMGPYRAGDAQAAVERLDRAVDGDGPLRDGRAPKRDRLLWLLERGKARFEVGDYAGSLADFTLADEAMSGFRAAEDKVDLPSQAAAVLWNDSVMSYRGRLSDRVLLRTFQALNAAALGEPEEARVYLRLAYQAQQDAVARAASRIQQAEQAASGSDAPSRSDQREDVRGVLASGSYREATASVRDAINPAYAPYANPLTTFLSGLLALGEGDPDTARIDLKRTLAMVPGQPAVQAALEAAIPPTPAAQAAGAGSGLGPNSPGGVYVLFERGLVGSLGSVQVPIPQPFTGLSVITVPRMIFEDVPPLSLEAPDGPPAARLASMNAVRAADVEAELPGIVTRQIISTGLKETATWFGSQAGDDDWIRALALIAGSLWKTASAGVDTRSWRLLGSEVELVRLDPPEDGMLTIQLAAAGIVVPAIELSLAADGITLVWLRSATGRAVTAVSIGLNGAGEIDRERVVAKRARGQNQRAASETRRPRIRTTSGDAMTADRTGR